MVKKEHGQLCFFLLEFLYMNSVAGPQLFERHSALENLIQQKRCAYMKKFLLALFCGALVVGVANLGHAFLFFGGGGGGSKKQPAGQNTLNLGSLSNFDFHQFGVKPETGGSGQTNSGSNFLDYCRKLPDSTSNLFDSNPDYGGAIFNQFDFASNRYRGNGGPRPIAQMNGAVFEPATMILFGLGLIGLAGYGRVKLNK